MSQNYFPYLSSNSLRFDRRLRQKLEHLPNHISYKIFSIYTFFSKEHLFTKYSTKNKNYIVAKNQANQIFFPNPMPIIKLSHTSCNYEKWLERKYTLPGFIEVEKNDIVIDCGAYVGGFSLHAAKIAKHIYIFEPDINNYKCIQKNFHNIPNITIENKGLYDQSRKITFNISPNSVEHSILTPDDGEIVNKQTIDVVSINDYCNQNNINKIDFCKVEAEGVELEIIEGMGDIEINKIAIDCSPERDNKSPIKEITAILHKRGYITKSRGYNLYAKKQ